MEPARSISRLGFTTWYERRLLEAHAWLVTALLCAIFAEASLEGMDFHGNFVAWLGAAGGIFIGVLIVWHGLRRYSTILKEAERLVSRATCTACKSYARFEVLSELPKIPVRCRKCRHEWTLGS